MDPFEELERMALSATADACVSKDEEPSHEQVTRWQRLFHYSHSDAFARIRQHRRDFARLRVSDEHWGLVRAEMEEREYDREAYEYKVGRGKVAAEGRNVEDGCMGRERVGRFVFRLEGVWGDAEVVRRGANLDKLPEVLNGVGEEGDAKFCVVDTATKCAIEEWLSREQISCRPTFIRLSKARKDLSCASACPTLGVDTTLPHNWPHQDVVFRPAQNEYPVWYFFYGTLGDPLMLSRVLGLAEEPALEPASIVGGAVKMWAGKYKALVDGPNTAHVKGWAYRVETEGTEDALRFYETEKYEVVRCSIVMNGGEVKGCTFRFIDESQLT